MKPRQRHEIYDTFIENLLANCVYYCHYMYHPYRDGLRITHLTNNVEDLPIKISLHK